MIISDNVNLIKYKHNIMKKGYKEGVNTNPETKKEKTTYKLSDYRAGHWPSTKTPPWWFNHNEQLNSYTDKLTLNKNETELVSSDIMQTDIGDFEIDIYAINHEGLIEYCAYPKGMKPDIKT